MPPFMRTLALVSALLVHAAQAYAQFATAPPEPQISARTPTNVTSGGRFSTSLTVAVPRARGPVPSIGLSYTSSLDNGLVGLGWRLEGFPVIVRSRDRGMKFDGSDKFVYLPGGWGSAEDNDNMLVSTNGSEYYAKKVRAGGPMQQFRPSVARCGDGPCSWDMRDGSGTIYSFGTLRLNEPANGVTSGRGIVAYALGKVTDADGNYLRITYASDGRTFWPTTAVYNLPESGGSGQRSMAVTLEYEARTDITSMPVYHSKRLSNIRVWGSWYDPTGQGILIRRYRLSYGLNAAGQSQLTGYQEFGSDGDAPSPVGLEPTTFDYAPGASGFISGGHSADRIASCVGSAGEPCSWVSLAADLNADGRADLIRAYHGSAGTKVLYRCGTNTGFANAPVVHTNDTNPALPYQTAVGDFDGDGRADLVAIYANRATYKLQTKIAFGGHMSGSCVLGSWVPQPDQPLPNGTNMTSTPKDWRIAAADIDGDGKADLVLYDRYYDAIYFKMFRNGRLSETVVGRFQAGVDFTDCGEDYHDFQNLDVTDHDGDGKADILVNYARSVTIPAGSPGLLAIVVARGTSNGLAVPTATCVTPATNAPWPAVRYPYGAFRQGDINGDGISDLTVSWQGKRISSDGVVHGQDIRFKLGASHPLSAGIVPWKIDANNSYPDADLVNNPKRINQWEFKIADINGDGIDDYIQSYYGRKGNKLSWAKGTPTGLGEPMLITAFDGGESASNPDGDGSSIAYSRTTMEVGDFNGDGLGDVARIVFDTSRTETRVELYLGNVTGFVTGGVSRAGGVVSGDARAIRTLVTDVNADGRDDLVFVNDSLVLGGSAVWLLSSDTGNVDVAGVPGLMTRIDNGRLGITTIAYRLARDFATALRPDWPDKCLGWDNVNAAAGWITGVVCGRIDSRPRALTRTVKRDHGVLRDGVSFTETSLYEYDNGRVFAGSVDDRADLGFASLSVTDQGTSSYETRWFRQDKPFDGSVASVTSYALGGTPLEQADTSYAQWALSTGPVVVAESEGRRCSFEAGVSMPCLRHTQSYDPVLLLPLERFDSPGIIIGDETYVTNRSYHIDTAEWLFRPRSLWTKTYSLTTPTVIDMHKFTYDTAAGKKTHLLKHERILFDDAETATCQDPSDPWLGACSERINNGAHWVPLFATSSADYDALGNLLRATRTPVSRNSPNPMWEHTIYLGYDPVYKGLVASLKNELNHFTSITYDNAGRTLTTTDANNAVTTRTYDVYGRLSTYAPPGVEEYQKSWVYPGLDTTLGYQIDEITYANRTYSHQVRSYSDGFASTLRRRDHSSIIGYPNPIDVVSQDLYIGGQRARRTSWPHFTGAPDNGAPSKWMETTFDTRGRPVRVARVNAVTYTTDSTASGVPAAETMTYSVSQGLRVVQHTDSNGATSSVKLNSRGFQVAMTEGGETTTFHYSKGLRLSQIDLPNTQYNTIRYTYDSWGRMKSEDDPNGEGFVRYTYDDAGKLTDKKYYATATTPQPTRTQHYNYDRLDRVTAETNGAQTTYVTYRYDELSRSYGKGRLTSVTDASGGTTAFDYDARGNVVTRTITVSGLAGATVYSYGYDDRNLLVNASFPDSAESFYRYNDGVLGAIIHNNDQWGSFEDFDAFKQPRKYNLFSTPGLSWSNTIDITRDADRRLARQEVKRRGGGIVQDLSYTYDGVGNVRTITDNRANRMVGSTNTDASQAFAYDTRNRLCATWSSAVAGTSCSTTSPMPSATFTYDGIGNLVAETGSITTYRTVGNQRIIENLTNSMPNWRAYHDSEGKRTRFEDCSYSPCVDHYYGYDYAGRLTSVEKDGEEREAYEYGFQGERTKKVYNDLASTTYSWFIGLSYTVRKNSNNTALSAKTHAAAGLGEITDGDLIAGQTTAATVFNNRLQPFTGSTDQAEPRGSYIRGPDLLGSASIMTRTWDGQAMSRNRFDAWGSHLAQNSVGQDTTHEKFTGQQREDFSRLQAHSFRYYHPKTRRFITPDDRIGAGSQGFNRFAYANNNPTSFTDRNGHNASASTCGNCGGGGGGNNGSGNGQGSGDGFKPENYSPGYQLVKWFFGLFGGDKNDRDRRAPPPPDNSLRVAPGAARGSQQASAGRADGGNGGLRQIPAVAGVAARNDGFLQKSAEALASWGGEAADALGNYIESLNLPDFFVFGGVEVPLPVGLVFGAQAETVIGFGHSAGNWYLYSIPFGMGSYLGPASGICGAETVKVIGGREEVQPIETNELDGGFFDLGRFTNGENHQSVYIAIEPWAGPFLGVGTDLDAPRDWKSCKCSQIPRY